MPVPLVAIIDDDPEFIRMIEAWCRIDGFNTLPLSGDEGALDKLREAPPDVIILDLWLTARGSGLQLLRSLRATDELAATPVIVCSGDAALLESEVVDAQALDCILLPKPFEPEALMALLRRHCGLDGEPGREGA